MDQTAASAEPQVPVAGLDDGSNRILRQPVAGQPDVEAVLGNQPSWIEGRHRLRLQGDQGAKQKARDARGRP